MPLYEYTCRGCGHQFEALVLKHTVPACPSCQSQDLERMLSLFAVDSDATRKSSLASARKKAAKETRDKNIADHEEMHHHHH